MRISDLDTRSAALGESTAYFAVDQASSNVTHKIDYNALAKAIIEQYTGSTIGGAAQSVKAAVDTVSNAIVVKNMPSSADFNNYTETGVWRCDLLETAVTNGPPVGTYVSGFLFVSKYNSNNIIQRFCFSGSSKNELTRFNWNGTWSAWVKQPTRAEMDALNNKIIFVSKTITVPAGSSSSPSTVDVDFSEDIASGVIYGLLASAGSTLMPYMNNNGQVQTWIQNVSAKTARIYEIGTGYSSREWHFVLFIK